jgi:hypothetical protein
VRRPPRRRSALSFAIALAAPAALGAEPVEPMPGAPAAGGRLAAVTGGELDLLGDLWAELPVPPFSKHGFFSLDTRTAIEGALSDVTLDVRDLQYDLKLGGRGRLGGLGLVGALGQRGRERVDADGQGFLRYAGVGVESSAARRPGRLGGELFVGGVVDEREVEGDVVLEGTARLALARGARGGVGLDLEVVVDAVATRSDLAADVLVAPRLTFEVEGDRRASFFVGRQRSEHPLGLEEDVWLAGFEYEEGPASAGPPGRAPDVDGSVIAGGGEGRLAGRLELRLLSPPFGRELRAAFLVDGNILTAEDTGELYYRYDVGLEHEADRGILGAYFHHRSNHQLAEPNDVVTSINTLEAGVETPGLRRVVGSLAPRRGGTLDLWARAGAILDSSFGEDEPWQVRGGGRLAWAGAPLRPFVTASGEAGEVGSWSVEAGLAPWTAIELGIEHLRDQQFFGEDRSAWLVTARYGLLTSR